MNERQIRITVIVLFSLIIVSFISFTQGKYEIDIHIITNWLFCKLGFAKTILWSQEPELILLKVRLPRIRLVSIVGASLAVSGTVLQSVFKNPLVSPYVLGVSAGASLGGSIVIVFF